MKILCAPWVRWSAALLLVASGLVAVAGAQPPPPPAFRADAELFIVKVQVVAARGKALPGLTAGLFGVRVGGRTRRVVFAELIRVDDGGSQAGPLPRGNETSVARRDDKFFQPFPGQASALYLLGVEATDAGRKVAVTVGHPDVTPRRWQHCESAGKCRLPPEAPPSR